MQTSDRHQVAVIGGGVVGVCCAAYLLRDGHRVTLIDSTGPGAGASRGNAGAISPGSCIPLAMPGAFKQIPKWLTDPQGPLSIRISYAHKAAPWLLRFALSARKERVTQIADALRALHRHVYDCYEPLVREARCEALIRRTGNMVVYETEAGFESSRNEWQMRIERGARIQFLSEAEIREIEPGLARRYRKGVLQLDHGFTVDPYQLVAGLAAQFQRDGGMLVRNTARGFRYQDGRVAAVILDDSEVPADRVVIAAGAWSKPLAASAGARVVLEDQRGYHIQVCDPKVSPQMPIMSSDSKIFATPMSGGLRIAGIVEFAGLDAPLTEGKTKRLATHAQRMFPTLNLESFTEWMGHRPCTPDTLPVIGPSPAHSEILLAFGHGHSGMTGGPVTGRLIADLVAGRNPLIDLGPYRANRFD